MLPTAIELPVKSLRAEVDILLAKDKDLNEAWSQPTVRSCQATGLQPSLLSPVRGSFLLPRHTPRNRGPLFGLVPHFSSLPASQNECA